jgi:hypothetical protein
VRRYNKDILEAVVESKTYEYGRDFCDMHHSKYNAKGRRSVPDHIFINKFGFIYFIEFKRWGEVPTAAQAREIKKLRDRGCTVYVCDNYIFGKMIMDHHKNTRMTIWEPS